MHGYLAKCQACKSVKTARRGCLCRLTDVVIVLHDVAGLKSIHAFRGPHLLTSGAALFRALPRHSRRGWLHANARKCSAGVPSPPRRARQGPAGSGWCPRWLREGYAKVTRRLRERGSAPPVSAAGGCDGCALARSAVWCGPTWQPAPVAVVRYGTTTRPLGGSLRAVFRGTIAYRGALPRLDPHREPKRPSAHLLPRRRLVQDAISREQGASAPEVPGVRQPAEHGNALP